MLPFNLLGMYIFVLKYKLCVFVWRDYDVDNTGYALERVKLANLVRNFRVRARTQYISYFTKQASDSHIIYAAD